MSFWKPIHILLRVRLQVARTQFVSNPTATLSTILVILLLLLAALSMGTKLGTHWEEMPLRQAEERLGRMWLEMQSFWLLALLAPGGLNLLGQIPPRATMLPFGLRPSQVFTAELCAVLLDAPALLACAVTLPFCCFLAAHGQGLQAAVTLLAFLFLGLQTGICACLLASLAALGARRLRRLALVPGITALLLIGLCAGLPPAFASLTSAPAQHLLPAHFSSPARFPAIDLAPLLPSRIAAHAVAATRAGDYRGVLGSLAEMAGCLLLSGVAAVWCVRKEDRAGFAGESAASAPLRSRTHSPGIGSRFSPVTQIAGLVRTEWNLLLRTPQTYLPLRRPAALLMMGAFAFLAPDMSKNPVYNLEEFLAIGALLYLLLWQMQLTCNRFGNDAGRGALLFGFSIPRRRLLLGKNLALFGLLVLIDSPLLIGMAFVAEVPNDIGLFLRWLPLVLLTLTSLGNLVSVLSPFSIQRQDRNVRTEPPDILASVYVLIGGTTVALLTGFTPLMSHGLVGWIGAVLSACALYAATLQGTSALLARREYQMIAALDRGGR